MKRITILLALLLVCKFGFQLSAIEQFYTYYDDGIKFMEMKQWERAIGEFKSTLSLEFEDKKKKRTYGTRFIKYFPHRELGICYFNLNEYETALDELQLSYAYKKSKRAEEYLKKVENINNNGNFKKEKKFEKTTEEVQQDLAERQKKLDEQRKIEENLIRKKKELEKEEKRLIVEKKKKEQEDKRRLEQEQLVKQKKAKEEQQLEKEKRRKEEDELLALAAQIEIKRKELEKEEAKLEKQKETTSNVTLLPIGALTYDPSKVTQVGSRLSLAVLNFEGNEAGKNLIDHVTEKLVTQLVNLRRFRVIERSALDRIMEEQKLGMTGFVDEETAVKVGKLAGADVIILGRIIIETGFSKVSARGIDTETSELIVAKEADSRNTDTKNIERLVEKIAIDIYNDLPLVEGLIMAVEEDQVILSIGSNVGVRKGTKCVAYKEGKKYYHPTTGEILGKNVTPLGELIVIQVQEKMSIAKPIGNISNLEIEDKVVVK